MKRVTIISAVCILAMLLCLSQCSNIAGFIGKTASNYYENVRAHPAKGTYFCSDLDAMLSFSEERITIRYGDGKTDMIYVNFGGGFVSESGDFFALYHWDQKADQITLTIKRFPYPYVESKEFLLTRSDE